MYNVIFNDDASFNAEIEKEVRNFLKSVATLEANKGAPIVIYQDSKSKGYYIKCGIAASVVCPILDTDAKLNPADKDSFRANRRILTEHNTYKRMSEDAKKGREFNDIIVEYNYEYSSDLPLKVWGGQHRARAIEEAFRQASVSRIHGFRVFFCLSKRQRTELV